MASFTQSLRQLLESLPQPNSNRLITMAVSDYAFAPPSAPRQDSEDAIPWDDSVARMKIGIAQLQLQSIAELAHYVYRNSLLTKGYEIELRDLAWQLAMQAKRLSKLGTILKQQDEATELIQPIPETDRAAKVYDDMVVASTYYTTLETLFLECTGEPLPKVRPGIDEWDRLPETEKTKKDFKDCKARCTSRQNRIAALQSYIEAQSTITKTDVRETHRCTWPGLLFNIKFAGARRQTIPTPSPESLAKIYATLTESMKAEFERAILHRAPPRSTDYTSEQTQLFFIHRKDYYAFIGLWLVEHNSGLEKPEGFEEFKKAVAGNWKQYTENSENTPTSESSK